MALNAYLTLLAKPKATSRLGHAGRTRRLDHGHATQHRLSPARCGQRLPTGKRQHKPFVITKEIDKSTPLLMNALVNNETRLRRPAVTCN